MGLEQPQNSRTYLIGREGDLRLADSTASAKHAMLSVLDGSYYLTDLDSTNGTWLLVEGERVRFREGYVTPQQKVAFGRSVLRVRDILAAVAL
jgi:pSer/pThr/pTyr-binding forkhead associated (FHA) protein